MSKVEQFVSKDYTIGQAYKMLSIKERHAVDLIIDYSLTNGADDFGNGRLGYLAQIINGISNHILRDVVYALIGMAQSPEACKESFLFLDIYQEE